MNADREPLAALVARLLVMGNGECGCPAVASPKFCEHEKAYIEAAMGAVPRLLAAVEAGTKCALLLWQINDGLAECWDCEREDERQGPREPETPHRLGCEVWSALSDWRRVAEPERKCPRCGGPLTMAKNSEGWRCAPCKTLVA